MFVHLHCMIFNPLVFLFPLFFVSVDYFKRPLFKFMYLLSFFVLAFDISYLLYWGLKFHIFCLVLFLTLVKSPNFLLKLESVTILGGLVCELSIQSQYNRIYMVSRGYKVQGFLTLSQLKFRQWSLSLNGTWLEKPGVSFF